MRADRQPYAASFASRVAALLLVAVSLTACTVPKKLASTFVAHAAELIEAGEDLYLAELTLEAALKADSTLADGWYYRGLLYADANRSRDADSCFAKALRVNAVHRPTLFARGQMRLRLGDTAGAMGDFTEIVFLYPRLPDGYRGRAWIFDDLGRTDEALAEWGRAIGVSPDDAGLYQERGFARLDAGMLEPSAEDFTTALALDATFSRSFAGRGEARYQLGLFSLALLDCDSALALDEGDAAAWLTRGRAADYSGQFDVALSSYRRFLRLVPESDADVPAVRERVAHLDR
jgi:tetratricopeptide (TPR) repeat protein